MEHSLESSSSDKEDKWKRNDSGVSMEATLAKANPRSYCKEENEK